MEQDMQSRYSQEIEKGKEGCTVHCAIPKPSPYAAAGLSKFAGTTFATVSQFPYGSPSPNGKYWAS